MYYKDYWIFSLETQPSLSFFAWSVILPLASACAALGERGLLKSSHKPCRVATTLKILTCHSMIYFFNKNYTNFQAILMICIIRIINNQSEKKYFNNGYIITWILHQIFMLSNKINTQRAKIMISIFHPLYHIPSPLLDEPTVQ